MQRYSMQMPHVFVHIVLIHLRELLAKPRNDLTCVPLALSFEYALPKQHLSMYQV